MSGQAPRQQPVSPGRSFGARWRGDPQFQKTVYRLLMLALVMASIVSALVLFLAPDRMQFAIILLFPALLGFIYMMRNPYLGVLIYFLIQFLRPQEFLPALRPLRLGMLIGVVTLISWVFNLIVRKEKIYIPRFSWLIIAFLGVIAVTTVTALNNRMSYDILHMMTVFVIIYIIATNVGRSLTQINWMVWMLLIIHFHFAIQGIGAGGRANTSLMGDENDYALALNTMLPFAYFAFEYGRHWAVKYFSLAMVIAFVLGTVSSMSRGGWVGLVAVVFFCIMQSKRKVVSLVAIAMLGIVVITFAPSKYWDEISTISDTSESTAQTRLNYWKASVQMFLDYPIIGVGANNGGVRMPQYVTGFANSNTQWGRTFHGTLPQVLAELGALGFGLYLIMFFYSLILMNRVRKKVYADEEEGQKYKMMANAIMGGLIGYLATATFLSTTYYPQLWTLYTLAIMLHYISMRSQAPIETIDETAGQSASETKGVKYREL